MDFFRRDIQDGLSNTDISEALNGLSETHCPSRPTLKIGYSIVSLPLRAKSIALLLLLC